MQLVPSPENPSLHSHIYEPRELAHLAFLSQGLEIHSLMSKIFNKRFMKIKMFSENVHKYNYVYKIMFI